ncbi:hypothetical protein SBRY_60477 [Actinacidiphila bryophytorum]|uniref:Uncharacterized protein n=1 Tax=Actinacidiphila bryophytorum TaxID=1436133 RepID=A0A9W4H6Q3_9ACTN|nr:hypothetical protein SBRY_60477 [Actinacidiphila bryophytorum]
MCERVFIGSMGGRGARSSMSEGDNVVKRKTQIIVSRTAAGRRHGGERRRRDPGGRTGEHGKHRERGAARRRDHSDLPRHALLVRRTGGRPGVADDAAGEGGAAPDQQRARHPAARRAAVHVLERGPARHQPARRRHRGRRAGRAGRDGDQLPGELRLHHVLGPGADLPGDHRDLGRGAWISRQVAVGDRAEQHRAVRVGLRRPHLLGAHGQHGPRPALGAYQRVLRRGHLPGLRHGRRLRQRLPGADDHRQADDPVSEGRGDREALRAQQRREQPPHAEREHHRRERQGLLHPAVRLPGAGRARVRRDDLVQRGERHASARRHLHGQRTAPGHLRLRRLHHLRLRRRRRRLRLGQPQLGAARLDHQRHHLDEHRHRQGDLRRGRRAGVRAAGRHPAELRRR